MTRPLALLLVVALAASAAAQSPRLIRVSVDFRQTVEQQRGGAERTVRRSSGIFTLVQDGGEALLTVGARIPFPQIAFYRDYATGAGHLAAGVAFQDVGTALKVRAALLPEIGRASCRERV